MKKFVLVLLVVPIFAAGCATRSVVRNHAGSPDGRTFWMSVENSGGESDVIEKSIWFCSSDNKTAPICAQAILLPCDPKRSDCAITADKMYFDELPSANR